MDQKDKEIDAVRREEVSRGKRSRNLDAEQEARRRKEEIRRMLELPTLEDFERAIKEYGFDEKHPSYQAMLQLWRDFPERT